MKKLLFILSFIFACSSLSAKTQADDIYYKDENSNTAIVLHDTVYIIRESDIDATYREIETNALIYYFMGRYYYRIYDRRMGWYFHPADCHHNFVYIGRGMHTSRYRMPAGYMYYTPRHKSYDWHRYHKGGYMPPKITNKHITIQHKHHHPGNRSRR